MEVESEDEDDEREVRDRGQPSQPDQDTQVQDMDEVRTNEDVAVMGGCKFKGIFVSFKILLNL